MKSTFASQQGQALVELALVVFLFAIFLQGLTQVVCLGTAQIKAQHAARRAAWLCHRFGNTSCQAAQVQAILPGCRVDPLAGRRQSDPGTVRVTYTVRAFGFFKWIQPQGFSVHAEHCIFAHVDSPSSHNLWQRMTAWLGLASE